MNVFMIATTIIATILYIIGSTVDGDTGKYMKNIAFGYIMGNIISIIVKLGPLLV